jgi:2-oxo-3-hexenedioate decarboxylase
MPSPAVERHADTMRRIWDDGVLQQPPSAGEEPFGIDEAYAISAELLRRREAAGWRRLGRKIGFTNSAVMREYGMSAPIFGYVYDRTVIHAESGHAALSLGGTVQPKIEPEIVFKLRHNPPPTRDPVALLESVEWLAQGFELVQCHYPDWVFAAPDAIADSGFHARYAVGAPTPVEPDALPRLADELARFRVELLLNGEVAAEGGGELVLGSPLLAFAHLIEVLAGLPGHPPLAAGELVTTGTLTAALPVTPGQTWTTRISGLAAAPLELQLLQEESL